MFTSIWGICRFRYSQFSRLIGLYQRQIQLQRLLQRMKHPNNSSQFSGLISKNCGPIENNSDTGKH
jgi:hypothetical protein